MCERNSQHKTINTESLLNGWQRIVCVWIGIAWLVGCQTLSLPSIDPTGNRIFSGGATTLINPHDPNNGYPSTSPAFRDPPSPPKCLGGDKCPGCLGCKLGSKLRAEDERGRCGELLLTPTKIVAPVDGEVILLAGVCGKDGLLVTNEKIEWMLSPESVGHFVEVGDDRKGQKPSFWKKNNDPKVEKLGIDFARGRTSNEPSLITKGTSDTSDDLPLRKGQTWISLSSPVEGTSKVTVLAPDSDVWDKRRQTATIYWVDASWDIPQPIVVVDDAPAFLVTKVMRKDGLDPAVGWTVRYRSLNPDFAQFETPDGYRPDAIATVDANGLARAKLFRGQDPAVASSAPRNGTALIEVEIERPAIGDMPVVPLARRTTSVTWSAPNLVLDVFGPEVASPSQNLQYVIRVSNTGDMPAENVEVIAAFPAGIRVDYSYRPQQETNGAAIWSNFGPIGPRNAFEVIANITPTTDLQGRVQVDVRVAGVPKVPTKNVPLIVQSPKVTLQFTARGNVAQAPLNSQIIFDGLLVNTGNQTINDLRVQIESDAGLVHEQSGNPIVVSSYPVIRPGERIPFEVAYRVVREGDSRVVASVSQLGQTLASQALGIRGIASPMGANPTAPGARIGGQPAIDLKIVAQPDRRRIEVGSTVSLKCVVSNLGQAGMRQPQLAILYDPAFQVQNLDPNTEHLVDQRLIRWTIRDMGAQQSLEFIATFVARAPIAQAPIEIEASSAEGLRDTKQVTLEIVSGSVQPGGVQPGGDVLPSTSLPGNPGLPAAPNPGGSGLPSGLPGLPSTSGSGLRPEIGPNAMGSERLSLRIQPIVDVIRRGDTVTYEVRVENMVSQPDQKVGLQLTIPKGAKVVAIKALALDYKTNEDGRLIEFTPIQFFRARDSFTYLIQIKHEESGQQTIVAAARSIGQPDPISTKHVSFVQ